MKMLALKKFLIIGIASWSISTNAQDTIPVVSLIHSNDTLICFSIPKTRYLIGLNEQRKLQREELTELYKANLLLDQKMEILKRTITTCQDIISQKDTLISIQDRNLLTAKEIIVSKDVVIESKDRGNKILKKVLLVCAGVIVTETVIIALR